MSDAIAQLDKSIHTGILDGHGTITIRVVVVDKKLAAAPSPEIVDSAPVDASAEESLPETVKRPISSFLEEPKRGHMCCVFLINGQRQHWWDNQFIVRDLDLKYLRNRMIVVIDCDGLKPEALAELMQGSRQQFYEGTVYATLESRVIATLKGDPDLRRLEEEAEDEISSLQAGDEAVKAALDQLIESHHEAASHIVHGSAQAGDATRKDATGGKLVQSQEVVIEADPSIGTNALEPVLLLHPDVVTMRLRPNERKRYVLTTRPERAWKSLKSLTVTFDPPVRELQVARTMQIDGEQVELNFNEPDETDDDEYPVETMFRCTAVFEGSTEPRLIERRLVVNPQRIRRPKLDVALKDDPTFIRVTSRQPIKIFVGGADVHVKLRWDGRDELISSTPPLWVFRVACESTSSEPLYFLTRPTEGRFELLIQADPGLVVGQQLKFDVEASGQGKTLSTAFLVDVAEMPTARKISTILLGGAQRRPPYALLYVKQENWEDLTCWGDKWNGTEPGSFEEPSVKSPLTIFINQDMDLLATYRDSLLARKFAESTIEQRINRYTTHIAFHLYQMYEISKVPTDPDSKAEIQSEEQMRGEIQRVAKTLITLMEVIQ